MLRADRSVHMLMSEQMPAVRCPSCGTSLRGDFEESPVSIDGSEMSVSLLCEGCGGHARVVVGPIPPDGRKVDVTVEQGNSQYL
jgi:hypothetical protein